jgi:hypothetical protein
LLARSLPVRDKKPTNKNDIHSRSCRLIVLLVGETKMKNFSILVTAAMAGVLVAATVFAASLMVPVKPTPASAPDRAAAYALATAK